MNMDLHVKNVTHNKSLNFSPDSNAFSRDIDGECPPYLEAFELLKFTQGAIIIRRGYYNQIKHVGSFHIFFHDANMAHEAIKTL